MRPKMRKVANADLDEDEVIRLSINDPRDKTNMIKIDSTQLRKRIELEDEESASMAHFAADIQDSQMNVLQPPPSPMYAQDMEASIKQ